MKLSSLLTIVAVLSSCGPRTGCEPVTDQISRCVTNDSERGRLDLIYAAAPSSSTQARDRVKSLERGITGGPATVAVDSCGSRDRLYIVQGLFDVEVSSSPFDVEDVSGNHVVGEFGMDQGVARAKRDSLRASSSHCLVWSDGW